MAKESYVAVGKVVSARTQAFGNAMQRRTRADAIINTAMRARSLRERYGTENAERINRAARNMVNRLI